MSMNYHIKVKKVSLLYCQFCHMYRTYIQRIEIALLSDPWCIQITLTVERKNTDKYKSNIYIYILHIQVHLNKLECRENVNFSCNLFQKVKLSYILDSLHVK